MEWSREHAVAVCSAADESVMVGTLKDDATIWDTALRGPNLGTIDGTGGDIPGIDDDASSPENIDWAYLDAVLDGSRDPMDLSFDFGETFGP